MSKDQRRRIEEAAEKHLNECAKCAGVDDRRWHKKDFTAGAEFALTMVEEDTDRYNAGFVDGAKEERAKWSRDSDGSGV